MMTPRVCDCQALWCLWSRGGPFAEKGLHNIVQADFARPSALKVGGYLRGG